MIDLLPLSALSCCRVNCNTNILSCTNRLDMAHSKLCREKRKFAKIGFARLIFLAG